MSLLVVGMNHRTAPVRLLERAAVPPRDLAGLLTEVLGGEHVGEAMVLSTCNRVEVYAGVTGFHGALNEIGQLLADRTGLPIGTLADHLYVRYADDAVHHLFTVVAGLDSMVVGESQVLGQLRDAYTAADLHGGAGRLLHEAVQRALRVGKRVHSDTQIDRAGRSVVSAALRVGADRIGPLAGRAAAVVGAGSLGSLAAAALRGEGVGALTVLNRSPDAAARLAASAAGRPGGLDGLPSALVEADVVVTATNADTPVITHADVAAALSRRGGRELLVVDLAVPRDTERAVDTLPGVVVLDIEGLAASLTEEPGSADVAAATAIVAEEVEGFLASQRSTDVAPTVVALRARADQVVAAEVARLQARVPDLAPAARAEVEKTVRRVVSTLLHTPTVRMKELASAPGGDRYAAAVRELFLLDVASLEEAVGLETVDPAGPGVRP